MADDFRERLLPTLLVLRLLALIDEEPFEEVVVEAVENDLLL